MKGREMVMGAGAAARREGEGRGFVPVCEGGGGPPPRPNRSMSEELWVRGASGKHAEEEGLFAADPWHTRGWHASVPAPALPHRSTAHSPLAGALEERPRDSTRAAGGSHGAGALGAPWAGDLPRATTSWAPGRRQVWGPWGPGVCPRP